MAGRNQALSDDQVAGELRKMVEFIKKEAEEKAKEIELKANEEYEIEKANIVRSETSTIDQAYEHKYKQEGLSQQISKSTLANKVRLKVLAAKEEVLDSVLQAAAEKLKTASKDKAKYEKVLVGLIEEGLYALLESTAYVRFREKDLELINKAIPEAAKNYEEKTKKSVEIKLDSEYLPADSAGGVVISNATGKIDINNTFEERLRILSESALPEIRLALFGPSLTRKFFE